MSKRQRTLKEVVTELRQYQDLEHCEGLDRALDDLAVIAKSYEQSHEIKELSAQLAHVYHFAAMAVKKLDRDHCMGSGLMLQMHGIGGKEACLPFVLKDGMSKETVESLLKDIQYSYDRAVEFKP